MIDISIDEGRAVASGLYFDAQLTLIDSAQSFSWVHEGGARYSAVVGDRYVELTSLDDGFSLYPCTPNDIPFFMDYFDLRRDYGALGGACHNYPVALAAINLLPGLRVLKQPVWDTLISFIISANNNVGRIRRLVAAVCREYGREITPGKHAFPTPRQLYDSGEPALTRLGMGYRANYLIETSRAVIDGFPLWTLAGLPYDQAHRELLKLKGVGDKVADCVQLFALGQTRAFPVDVWVGRLMRGWFGMEEYSNREISLRAIDMFGDEAGLVQQFLFHCARLGFIDPEGNVVGKDSAPVPPFPTNSEQS